MTSVVFQRSSTVALWMLRNGSSENPDSTGEHTISPVRSVDPRRAYTLSPAITDVLLSFTEKAAPKSGSVEESKPAQTAKIGSDDAQHQSYRDLIRLILSRGDDRSMQALRDFDLGKNRGIGRVLATLPRYLAMQFEESGGADLAEPRKIRLSDEDIGKDVVENILHIFNPNYPPDVPHEVIEEWVGRPGEYDPNDLKVQALLNGTGKFIRATDYPEIGYKGSIEKIYAPDPMTGEIVETGERSAASIDSNFVKNFEKKNPGFKIHIVYTYQDAALFIYPISTRETSSSLELTGAHALNAPTSNILLRYRVTAGRQVP